jgi:hypothetical protein
MKKIYFIFAAIIVLAIAAALSLNPYKSANTKSIRKSVTSIIPGDVATILQNSCTGCHGEGGGKLARSRWDFSSWNTYSAKKQYEKSTDICNAMTDGSMPPADFQETYPDKTPTAQQIEIVCKWANSLIII